MFSGGAAVVRSYGSLRPGFGWLLKPDSFVIESTACVGARLPR